MSHTAQLRNQGTRQLHSLACAPSRTMAASRLRPLRATHVRVLQRQAVRRAARCCELPASMRNPQVRRAPVPLGGTRPGRGSARGGPLRAASRQLFSVALKGLTTDARPKNVEGAQLKPDPAYSAEASVKVQLDALRDNNAPYPDHGIHTLYEFCAGAGGMELSRYFSGKSSSLYHLDHFMGKVRRRQWCSRWRLKSLRSCASCARETLL